MRAAEIVQVDWLLVTGVGRPAAHWTYWTSEVGELALMTESPDTLFMSVNFYQDSWEEGS